MDAERHRQIRTHVIAIEQAKRAVQSRRTPLYPPKPAAIPGAPQMAFVGRLHNLDLSRSCYPSYGAPTLTPVRLSPTDAPAFAGRTMTAIRKFRRQARPSGQGRPATAAARRRVNLDAVYTRTMAAPVLVTFAAGGTGPWRVDRLAVVASAGLPLAARLAVYEGASAVRAEAAVWALRGTTSNTRYTNRAEVAARGTTRRARPSGCAQSGANTHPKDRSLVGARAR